MMNVVADELLARLARIEYKVDALAQMPPTKEFYTTKEFATAVDASNFTVRQWCNKGCIEAKKAARGRGQHKEWRIPNRELIRFRNEGPLLEGVFQND
jgi:hypothetical protein